MAQAVNNKFYAILHGNYMRMIEAGHMRAGSEEADALFAGIRVACSPISPYLDDLEVVLHDMPRALDITEWWKVFPVDDATDAEAGGAGAEAAASEHLQTRRTACERRRPSISEAPR